MIDPDTMSERKDWFWMYWMGFGGRSGEDLWLKRRFSVACEISQTIKIEAWGYHSGRMSDGTDDRSIRRLCRKVRIGFGCIGWGLVVVQEKLYGSNDDSITILGGLRNFANYQN